MINIPELRKDIILDRWVIIGTPNSCRYIDLSESSQINNNNVSDCPFCPGKEDLTPPEILAYRSNNSLPNTIGWNKRVIPNKFPVLQIEGDLNRTGIGMYDKMNGLGAHEIIIESPDHNNNIEFSDMKTIENTIWAYRDRIIDLKKDHRLKYILLFKNYGLSAGSKYNHPHSELIAMPVIPKHVNEELSCALRYYRYKERCVFCDILKQELTFRERIISENNSFISFHPFASLSPFETWIIPKRHHSNFEEIMVNEVEFLAKILQDTLKRMIIALNNPAYNYVIHTAPLQEYDLRDYHWHIEITPQVIKPIGFEWGTDFFANPNYPEDTAKYLRNLKV